MRAETLRPEQFQQILRQTPLVYQPVGTIEWYGQHLASGNDALKAHGARPDCYVWVLSEYEPVRPDLIPS